MDEILSGHRKRKTNLLILFSYLVFGGSFLLLWKQYSNKDFSFVLTISGGLQALAFFMLLNKVRVTRSVAGLSEKTLQVYALVFVFRLSSTLVKNGYLPVDPTGDWVFQATDIMALLFNLQVLYLMRFRFSPTCQRDLDTMPIWRLIPAVGLLACTFHGDLNHSAVFDKAWSLGMWLDTVALVPQLWMLVAKGGEVEALTSNFVALMTVSKAFAFSFWYTGYPELAPRDGGFNKVGALIMTAHSIQLLLSADFMYHYFQHKLAHGCGMGTRMVLPRREDGTFEM